MLSGPCYFDDQFVTGYSYLRLLHDYFLSFIDIAFACEYYFSTRCSPPHYKRAVRDLIDVEMSDPWIDRGCPVNWSALSSDLTPPSFFLRGFVRETDFKTPGNSSIQLKHRITSKIWNIAIGVLRNVKQNMKNCFSAVIQKERKFRKHSET